MEERNFCRRTDDNKCCCCCCQTPERPSPCFLERLIVRRKHVLLVNHHPSVETKSLRNWVLSTFPKYGAKYISFAQIWNENPACVKCEKKKTLHSCSRTVHLAGLIHGAGDDEGTVPVELNVADFASVTHQGVDTAEKREQKPSRASEALSRTQDPWLNCVRRAKRLSDRPDATSQTASVWSKDPVTSWSPVVLKHRERTSAAWPWARATERGFTKTLAGNGLQSVARSQTNYDIFTRKQSGVRKSSTINQEIWVTEEEIPLWNTLHQKTRETM